MRKLSSIFLVVILMLAFSSTAQVVRCETEQVSAKVKPLSGTVTVPISGDLNPEAGYSWKWYGPWGGAGSKITKIIVQFSWTPTSCGAAAMIYDVQTHYWVDYPPNGGFLYGGYYSHAFFITGSSQYDQWEVGITAKTNGVWMHFNGYIYIIYG
jgi:hypothetical protein